MAAADPNQIKTILEQVHGPLLQLHGGMVGFFLSICCNTGNLEACGYHLGGDQLFKPLLHFTSS